MSDTNVAQKLHQINIHRHRWPTLNYFSPLKFEKVFNNIKKIKIIENLWAKLVSNRIILS
jgi:hypothetical protein